MRLVILEGARGTGKSSLAFQARQKLESTTLINFTGFKDDGVLGHQKISSYYDNWMDLFKSLEAHDSTFVCDRFFFSEMVYSQLYKSYDFRKKYAELSERLSELDVTIAFFTITNEEELEKRLIRDKLPFAHVEESVKETMNQQAIYRKVIGEFAKSNNLKENVRIFEVDTSNKSLLEVEREFFALI